MPGEDAAALASVRAELGKEYDLLIAGERRKSNAKLESVKPVHVHLRSLAFIRRATEQDAQDAVEAAYGYFDTWSSRPCRSALKCLLRTADIIRERKYEFDAWLVLEAGKTWAEAEG